MINGKVFWGIVTAAAAGAVIGLLVAPEDGKKMRKKIKKSANDWATDMIDALEKGKGKVLDAAEQVKIKGEKYKDEALASTEDAIDTAQTAVNKAK
ncbi:hypothetical protein GCM10027275_19230 [Rhabdobacter roseus]|uniref:Gas vesicle protein n=1 Tax=Rhabdobacter roseus TaxID=1655419 RepID=A0A840TW33_9BACT|nr:YtxH domain-containing protein [Rhabdobacter roseus]MBB5283849.1 gas vesicle protein [Rhabdobacter roseus]